MLETQALTHKYLGLTALNQVSLRLEPGELVGLIGPNGSGKTTLFNCVTGFVKPTAGRVLFEGHDITGQDPHRIALRGLMRTFQQTHVFEKMTVLENLQLALQQHQGERVLASLFGLAPVPKWESQATAKAMALLELGNMLGMKDALAGSLSYGQQKILAILAALMSDPKLVMLDEPTAGINPTLIEGIKKTIQQLNAAGLTFLIVEHNMDFVMSLCRRVIVLSYGNLIADGDPAEIRANPEVIEAYFGA